MDVLVHEHELPDGCEEFFEEVAVDSQLATWTIPPDPVREAHFACFPRELVRRCLISATSRGGCCSACGSQYAPVIEHRSTPTRRGTGSEVARASDDESSPYHDHGGTVVGNRDPQRHTTTTVVTGHRPTCDCNAAVARPVVLDMFSGSGTTGQVAIHMGCDYVGIEANPDYVVLNVKRLNTPWKPKIDIGCKPPELVVTSGQLELF